MSEPDENYRLAAEAYAGKDFAGAESHCRSALLTDGNYAPAYALLGRVLTETGRHREAIVLLQGWLSRDPQSATAQHGLGLALAALGRPDEALFRFRRAAALQPAWADPLIEIGRILAAQGHLREAEEILSSALVFDPTSVDCRLGLGTVLCGLERYEDALEHLRAVPVGHPGYVDAQLRLANALFAVFQAEDALAVYEGLRRDHPSLVAAHLGAGYALRTLGRLVDARAACEAALELAPNVPTIHRAVAESKTFRPDDTQLATLQDMAKHAERFPIAERVALHFTLAKACHDIGDFDRSFENLRLGNSVHRGTRHYDEAAVLGQMRRIGEAFPADLLRERAGQGHPTDVPVFVVGMPRSGTTLVEQIIASHPEVIGMGEQRHLSDLIENGLAGPHFPNGVASLSPQLLFDLGARYLARLPSGAQRVSDKLPANFRNIGLIRLALPQARIIHVRRDAMDTCFSCYRHHFVAGLEYTNDLGELGRYFRAYETLMDHWRQALPPETILEIDYEDLVGDLEGNARKLVAYCGLEWDARCLSFHKTERPIYTVSVEQVRKPLYASSVGIWRAYEKHLGPLKAALA